jgi:hypothetical protein
MNYFIIGLILYCNFTYGQDEITLTEGIPQEICGRYVILDGVWADNGVQKADITVLLTMQSKPITGGYSKGTEINISDKSGCKFYVYSILKYGKNKGTVVLSAKFPEKTLSDCKESITFWESVYQTNDFVTGIYSWSLSAIPDTNTAVMKMANKDSISTLTLKKGDVVWMGECLYRLDVISLESWDNVKDPDGHYEMNPAEINLKKVQNYYY